MARPILDEAEIMKAVRAGERHASVAKRFGCSRPRVSQIALKNGFDSRAAYDAQCAQKRVERLEAEEAPEPRRPGPPPTPVPAWAVRAGLEADYRDFALEFDDDHAARECRKLTAERRRLEALDARLGRAA